MIFFQTKTEKRMRGYSVVELLVYISILAVIFLVVTNSLVSIYDSYGKARIERNLTVQGSLVMETLVRDIRLATSTDVVLSTFGTHPGVLDLFDRAYSLSGNTLHYDTDSGISDDITSAEFRITNLVFYRTATSTSEGETEIIKIEMTAELGQGKFLKNKNFFASALLRGAY
jgi:type II secretory pathway pseudopilin PulG